MLILQKRLLGIRLSIWLKIAASLFLLAIAFNSGLFEILWRGFDTRLLWAVLVVQPLILLGLILHAIRHIILIGKPKVHLMMAVKAIALSQGLSVLLPGRLSELLKGTYLRDHGRVPLSIGISAVILERTIDLLIVTALGYLGWSLFMPGLDFKTILFFSVVGATILIVALFAKDSLLRMIRALPWPRFASFSEQAYLHFSATVRTNAFFKSLILGLAIWALSYTNILVFLSIAGGVPIGFSGALLVLVFTTIGGAVPLLPGGLGTYELSAVVALRMLEYKIDDAIPIALALHFSQLILLFVMAFILMLSERTGLSSLMTELRASAHVPRS